MAGTVAELDGPAGANVVLLRVVDAIGVAGPAAWPFFTLVAGATVPFGQRRRGSCTPGRGYPSPSTRTLAESPCSARE